MRISKWWKINFRLVYYIGLACTKPTMCRECTNVVVASLWCRPGGSCHGRSRFSRYASTLRCFLTLGAFQRHLLVFLKLLGTCRDGKSGFSVPEGDRQPDQVQRSPEVEVVLPDVSKTMSRRGGKVFTSASCWCIIIIIFKCVVVVTFYCVSLVFVDRTVSNVTACPSPTRGNCCWPRRTPTGSWTTSPSRCLLQPLCAAV